MAKIAEAPGARNHTNPTATRLAFLDRGFAPIPDIGKRPAFTAWPNCQPTAEIITAWERNYPEAANTGILTRSTPILDIDIADEAAAAAVEDLVRERFDGHAVLTRIGAWPKRAVPFQTLTPFTKIVVNLLDGSNKTHRLEFLADGQQCVVDGIHPDTKKPYLWPHGSLREIHHDELPGLNGEADARALIDAAAALLVNEFGYRREEERPRPQTTQLQHNGPADWGWFLDHLIDHDDLAPFAMSLLVAERDAAIVNLLTEMVKRIDADPARKARRLAEIPRLVASARAKLGPAPVAQVVQLRPDSAPRIKSSAEFAKDFIPPDYLVQGLLITAYAYSLTGATGSGKTAITLRLAAAVAMGWDFAGLETERRRVLYLAAENPVDVQMRWIALSQHMGFDLDTIAVFFVEGVFKISQLADALKTEAERVGGNFGLVIIDTGPAFYEGDDQNSRTQQQNHARMLRELVTVVPGRPTVVANMHPVKNAGPDNLIPAGGGTFLNEIDGNFTANKTDATVELHWQGKLRGVEFAPLHFLIETVTHERLKDKKGRLMPTVICQHLSADAKDEIARAGVSEQDRVLAFLETNPKASWAAVAIAMNWRLYSGDPHKTKASRVIKELTKARLVEVDRHGVYTVTEKGKKALEETSVTAGPRSGPVEDSF